MFEWIANAATWPLLVLLTSSFASATILPFPSEATFLAYLSQNPQHKIVALITATIGNTLGGLTTYWLGRWLPPRGQASVKPSALALVNRYGAFSLLLSWLPIIGDAMCLIAGWLKMNWIACVVAMAVGKFARYWVLMQAF
jgi:membrane protein YqaA with SNARE-associated domain